MLLVSPSSVFVLQSTCRETRLWLSVVKKCSLLRVDAVDGADHPLVELLLESPPLRLRPGVTGKTRNVLAKSGLGVTTYTYTVSTVSHCI